MNEQTEKADYLFLFRGTNWDEGLSTEEMQQVVDRIKGWLEGMQQQGKFKGGQPLGAEARTLSGKKGRTVADGPFAESKEAVGGFIIVQADSLDEAAAIAKGFPVLDYGGTVEVRPVLDECPTFQRVKQRLAQMAAV